MWPNMMGGFFGGGEFIWMFFIFIFVLAIIVGIILLIALLVKRVSFSGGNIKTDENNALKILKERYVRGEITKKEFETIKKDIG